MNITARINTVSQRESAHERESEKDSMLVNESRKSDINIHTHINNNMHIDRQRKKAQGQSQRQQQRPR